MRRGKPLSFEQHVRLTRDRSSYVHKQMYVAPVVVNERWVWIDKAGYAVAEGTIIEDFQSRTEQYEFVLNVPELTVTGHPYLAHQ